MAKGRGGFISLELNDDEKIDAHKIPALADRPDYPYGLCISLDERSLEKLGLDLPDHDPEDPTYIELSCCARVTSVSSSTGEDGQKRERVELQIEAIKIAAGSEPDDDGDGD